MKRVVATVHQCLSVTITVAAIVEFFFAGMGVFHATSFQIHRVTGVLLWGSSAVLLLLALIGRAGGKRIALSALLFVLMFIQPLILQINEPFVKALHPVNGVAILAISAYLSRLGARGKSGKVSAVGS